jgi:hypothetical protein
MRDAASQLYDYMTLRARREGVRHTLTEEFYRRALRRGCVSFFGVQVKGGELVAETTPRPVQDMAGG